MSETPVVPASADPTPSVDVPRLSVPQYLLFLLLAGAGMVAILGITVAAYGIAREYGSPSIPWLGLLPWALVPAGLWTAAMAVVRRCLGPRVWSPWLVGLVVLVLTTLLAGGLTAAAASAHDADAASLAGACSASEITVLTSVPGYSAGLGEPTGQADGSCFVTLAVQGDATAAVASVAASLTADGWTTTPPSAEGIVLATKGGDPTTLVVSARGTDDKGMTDVVVAVPAG